MFGPQPDEVVVTTSAGIDITAEDVAALIALAGILSIDEMEGVLHSFHPEDKEPIRSVYYKSRILMNDALTPEDEE